MPEYKFKVINNYIFLEDADTSATIEGIAKDIHIVQKQKTDGNAYEFKRMSDQVIIASIPYVSIKDENGDDFASESAFIEYYTSNTGQN